MKTITEFIKRQHYGTTLTPTPPQLASQLFGFSDSSVQYYVKYPNYGIISNWHHALEIRISIHINDAKIKENEML